MPPARGAINHVDAGNPYHARSSRKQNSRCWAENPCQSFYNRVMGKELLVAGIESSCDETAIAILRGDVLLSSLVASQDVEHAPYGGVVPELAARRHLEVLPALWDGALAQAGVNATELDGIAVTRGPGLAGSLLTGVAFARGLARSLGKPLVGINHVRAHLAAARLLPVPPEPPFLGLIVSGGIPNCCG
jgi:N6-L-threonylcarbamoyladenine synthase